MPKACECVQPRVHVHKHLLNPPLMRMNAGPPHADDRYTDAASATHPSSKNAKSSAEIFFCNFYLHRNRPTGRHTAGIKCLLSGSWSSMVGCGLQLWNRSNSDSLDLSCWQLAQSLNKTQQHPGRLNYMKSFCIVTYSKTQLGIMTCFRRNSKENQRIQKYRNKRKCVACRGGKFGWRLGRNVAKQ